MRSFFNQLSSWSQKTHGTDSFRGPKGPLVHLQKEVAEALAAFDRRDIPKAYRDIDLKEEIVDCLFLTLDAARRSGMTYDGLIEGAFTKLAKNRKRTWGPMTADGAVEHVRGESVGAGNPRRP